MLGKRAVTSLQPYQPPNVGGLVGELRALYHLAGIDLMLRIGELILDRLYGGDAATWHSRGKKDISFRKLQEHPELPFRASMLSRAVSIYVLSQRRSDLRELQNVSPSHLQEIISLEAPLQDDLLAQVEREKWSTQKLREEVARRRPKDLRRPGRPRSPAFSRYLRGLKTDLGGRILLTDTDELSNLELGEAIDLLETARSLVEQAGTIAELLADHVQRLETEASVNTNNGESIVLIGRGVSTPKHLLEIETDLFIAPSKRAR
jgi:hypothetical protein